LSFVILEDIMLNFDMLLFSGNSNPELAKRIAEYLGTKLGDIEVARFSEGEVRVKINENVRGRDVFIIQSTCSPVNDNLMELLIMIDAMRRASASRITAVIPYFGYARQDRKDQPRVPITAKLVANLITAAGTNRVITVDLHAGQIQGFFDIPLDHLFAAPILIKYLKELHSKNLVVVSPDVGGVKMARAFAKRLEADLAIVDKRRISGEETEVMNIMGDVSGKEVIIVDDLVATASSLVEAAAAVKKNGAKKVYAGITHPVLSGKAMERLNSSDIEKLIVTDTIPIGDKKNNRIEILSVAELLGEGIKRIHRNESVSSLF
jgi:ribose-phosphate pyrophosphokinase